MKKLITKYLCICLVVVLLLGMIDFGSVLAMGGTAAVENTVLEGTSAATQDNLPVQIEAQRLGLVDFTGDYALTDDETPVEVIVLFRHYPAAVQAHLLQIRGIASFSDEMFVQNVEDDHALFRQEFSRLAGPVAFTDDGEAKFEIIHEFRIVLNGAGVRLPSNRVAELANFASVSVVMPNFTVYYEEPPAPIYEPVPTDISLFSTSPWGMRPGRYTMRADKMHELGFRGEGVVVAVPDTGVYYMHHAFRGAFLTIEQMQARGVDVTNADGVNKNGTYYFLGRNHLTGGHEPPPNRPGETPPGTPVLTVVPGIGPIPVPSPYGTAHGTHVAGIIVGRDSGRPGSILGVAPEANLIAYRFLNLTWNSTRLDTTIRYEQIALDRPDVVNMSYGPPLNSDNTNVINLTTMIQNNFSRDNPNVVMVRAAGNSGSSGDGWYTSVPMGSIALVTASADLDLSGNSFNPSPEAWTLSDSSSQGPIEQSFEIIPRITAQGVRVISAVPPWGTELLGSRVYPYFWLSGTSMAAPHIAGAAAILIQFSRENGGQWTAEEIKTRIMNQAISFGDGTLSAFGAGAGYVDVYAAAHATTVVYASYDRVIHGHGDPLYGGTWPHNLTLGETRTGAFSFGGVGQIGTEEQLTLLSSPSSNVRVLEGTIENQSNVQRRYIIEHAFLTNPNNAATLTLSQREFTVPANSYASFTATMTVGGTVVDGFYEGHVLVRCADTNNLEARLPFALVHGIPSTFVGAQLIPQIAPTINVPASLLSFELNGPINESASFDPINVLHGTSIFDFLGRNYREYTQLSRLPYHGGFMREITRDNYTFAGWYINANFTPESRVTETTTMPATPVTLYARWLPLAATLSGHIVGQSATWEYIDEQTVTVTITGDTFADTLTGNWITNLPHGLVQSVERINDTTAAITVSGMAHMWSFMRIRVTLPAGALVTNSNTALVVPRSENAVYNIDCGYIIWRRESYYEILRPHLEYLEWRLEPLRLELEWLGPHVEWLIGIKQAERAHLEYLEGRCNIGVCEYPCLFCDEASGAATWAEFYLFEEYVAWRYETYHQILRPYFEYRMWQLEPLRLQLEWLGPYIDWRTRIQRERREYYEWREWLCDIGICEYPCLFCSTPAEQFGFYLLEDYLAWLDTMYQQERNHFEDFAGRSALPSMELEAIREYIEWLRSGSQIRSDHPAYLRLLCTIGACEYDCEFC